MAFKKKHQNKINNKINSHVYNNNANPNYPINSLANPQEYFCYQTDKKEKNITQTSITANSNIKSRNSMNSSKVQTKRRFSANANSNDSKNSFYRTLSNKPTDRKAKKNDIGKLSYYNLQELTYQLKEEEVKVHNNVSCFPLDLTCMFFKDWKYIFTTITSILQVMNIRFSYKNSRKINGETLDGLRFCISLISFVHEDEINERKNMKKDKRDLKTFGNKVSSNKTNVVDGNNTNNRENENEKNSFCTGVIVKKKQGSMILYRKTLCALLKRLNGGI